MDSLSLKQARRLAILSQGLHCARPFGAGLAAVQRCIEQLGYLQIDTISVINRSHHHCCWTRLPSYTLAQLDTLQKQRQIFEYWTHAAAYLPMRDYRFCLPYMQAIATGQRHWRRPDRKAMQAVRERVRIDGPVKAKDFENVGQKSDEWGWNWKPAKIALEQLFIEGELVVSHREGFQKVYDLPERVLPSGLDTSMPSSEEYSRYLILSTLRAHGLAMEAEFSYLRKGTRVGVKEVLQQMLEAGELLSLRVGQSPGVWYSTPSALESLSSRRVTKNVQLLSPFDNAVIKRRRLQQLFASDYQLECFVPVGKRQFGYYCLPILYGTEIVGRLDPKADRRRGAFIVRSLHLEKPIRDQPYFLARLKEKLQALASFNGCERVVWPELYRA